MTDVGRAACDHLLTVRFWLIPRHMELRHGIIAAGVLALSGCSYIYDLRAVVINGQIAFIVDPKSRQQANCIRSIHVKTANGETTQAKPGPNDDEALVKNGVFWWKDRAVDQCLNKFPIRYGQPLAGQPFVYSGGDTKGVEAKPLVIGVVYEVDTGGSGSGYGGGKFRIRSDRTVENLPLDGASSASTTNDR